MSRVRVWYDDDCDQIFISGETHSFAPRSLICILNGGGSTLYVQMRGTEGAYIAGGSFADFGNHDGLPFDTPEDAKAYLDGVFSRWPTLDGRKTVAVAALSIPAGFPVALSRADGSAVLARADTYALSFVAGLASAEVAPGFAAEVVRATLTLPDWTAVTGAISLSVGSPYFLAVAGGMTTTPDRTIGAGCLVHLGVPLGAKTFAFNAADPIIL